jgi:ubiquinol-cytochrome c reductase cytochrome b subunit
MGGYFLEHANFEAANSLKTPEHIAPVWYFTPYYAMLRAVPSFLGSQFPGVAVMGAAVLILFFMPWIDRNPVKSMRYRGPLYSVLLTAFASAFLVLGWLGVKPPSPLLSEWAFRLTEVYFLFFAISWLYSDSSRGRQGWINCAAITFGVLVLIDAARFSVMGDLVEALHYKMFLVPGGLVAAMLLLPAYTRWNDPKPVPERVTH